ncbi:RRP12-like protein [Trifolium pratense]|uniref:RRP12-like protein n=1 Tax=Trifolium pratense TaxID=57577 RepID=UPI001E693919|nr:RRP12-like protein [Trifolium pratense]
MEEEHPETFNDASDLCQQLMDRYAKSPAPHHRHLLAVASVLRSNLSAESLPLTPPAYFAAAISTAASSDSLDSVSLSSLASFMAIALPLVPTGAISSEKAREAAEIVGMLLVREGEGLGVSSLRAAVKCVGVLLGFCDLEDWDSIKLGFETLLKFSIDKRPKVRRCGLESLEKFFRSLKSSTVVKDASRLVLSELKRCIDLTMKLTAPRTVDACKDNGISKNEHLEVLHVLNVVNLVAPNLSPKIVPKVLSEVHKLFGSQIPALTRHVLKTVEAIFETSRVRNIVLELGDIVVSLASFVSLGDKNPLDTVILAANVLKLAMDLLYTGQSSLWIKNLALVCQSMMGLLTSEGNTASQASNILNDVLKHRVGSQSLLISTDQTFDDDSQLSLEGNAIKSTCAVFENTLSAIDGIPNEHLLSVISVLFLELGGFSFVSMKNIVLKLADLMIQISDGKTNNEHIQKCIGSAVFAMGPERFLTFVPISLDEHSYTYSNIWLVPILKQYITGASLSYYVEHIMPLAKSFKKASRKVKKSEVSQDLLVRAQELWGLLPSFCRRAPDTYKSFSRLSDVLATFLKKDLSMHENVSTALQILVNENKAALSPKKNEADCDAEHDSSLEFSMRPAYSKKTATRNMNALKSNSNQLLHILSDLFISSLPQTRISLKGSISCLASIADSSITKEVFMSLLKRFELVDCDGEDEVLTSKALDIEPSDEKGCSQRCATLEIASCLVEGANDNLVEIIYNLTIHSFQVSNESIRHEAYNTLSKILEVHPCYSSPKNMELIDLLLGLKPPTEVASLRGRFACFHMLMVHIVKISLEEDVNSKAFLILNEIILTLKDGNDEARKEACDLLLNISSSLGDLSCVGPTEPYHKLVSMIMGYLSGSSPHIKSGAVSALSVLVYKDANLCVSISDLVPSLLSLLHSKDTETIKAVLGFFKVMVSCLEARELQNILSDVVSEIIRWSSVSRHHFKTKVTVIFEILIRKCGSAAVRGVTPEKYMDFLKTVLENRHGKSNEASTIDTENTPEVSAAKGSEWRKPNNSDTQENDSQQKKRKKFETGKTEQSKFRSNDEFRFAKRSRHSNDTNSNGRSEGSKNGNKSQFKSFTHGGGKGKVKPQGMGKDKAASNGRIGASKSHKLKGKFNRK